MRPYPPCEGVEHEIVDAGGLQMHVATAGPADGPVVVLLHGWPQHWWLWHAVMGPLADAGHRVLAPDLRGCGWSEVTASGYDKEQFATDILALLDALGVEQADVVGHDWGGWTAQLIAIRAPERVRRLGILNIPPVWQGPVGFVRYLHRFVYQPLVGTPKLGPALQRSGLTWALVSKQGIPAASVAVYREAYDDPARAEAGSLIYRTFLRSEVPGLLRGRYDGQRLDVPVRVLFGMDDAVIRRPMLEGFRDHSDDLQIEEVHDCGHFIVDEQPERVTAWLLRVLAEPV